MIVVGKNVTASEMLDELASAIKYRVEELEKDNARLRAALQPFADDAEASGIQSKQYLDAWRLLDELKNK